MAARSTFTRTSGSVITSAWANSLRDHVVPYTSTDDVTTEGMLAVNTTSDQLVVRTASGVREVARYTTLSSLTVTVTQITVGVAHTLTGGWSRNGAWVDVAFRLAFTAAGGGTAAISVAMSGPPVPDREGFFGGFTYVDSGTAVYTGEVNVSSTGVLTFNCHNVANALGQTPAFSISSSPQDTLDVCIRYPSNA